MWLVYLCVLVVVFLCFVVVVVSCGVNVLYIDIVFFMQIVEQFSKCCECFGDVLCFFCFGICFVCYFDVEIDVVFILCGQCLFVDDLVFWVDIVDGNGCDFWVFVQDVGGKVQ